LAAPPAPGGKLLTEIEKLTGVLIDKLDYPDFKPGPVPADVREERERAAPPERKEPGQHLIDRAAPSELDGLSEEELKRMFPGGVIPKKRPAGRTLGSRFRTKRSR
jgi:hypothetical protein